LKHLTILSWGFWGWGTSTPELIAAVDAAERKRGFAPPIFVDIRLKRSGRAPGFNGRAFEDLLGWQRYRWMPSLGNNNIGTRKAARIACPTAAAQLLDVALEAQHRSARVIFFCACESPWQAQNCHRHLVAKLAKRWAQRRRVLVDVLEWPGGRPAARQLRLRVSPETLRDVASGAQAVPIQGKRVPVNWCGIPWGTIVMLKAGLDELPVAIGPAAYRLGRWVLPRFQDHDVEPAHDVAGLHRQSAKLRRRYGL
jgi:hypothetical protein